MVVYYLQNKELGWDNICSIGISPQKCIEDYTGGNDVPKTEKEVSKWLKENKTCEINETILAE